MIESGYYPPGAQYNPNAPYNDIENPEKEVEIYCYQSLEKTINESTSDYEIEHDVDENGKFDNFKIDNSVVKDIYEADHNTPLQLINMFKRVLEMQLKGETLPESLIKHYINECDGWEEEDSDICGTIIN